MTKKKSFVLRVDEDVYKALELWAAAEFRSVNGQLEFLIHEALKRHKRIKTTAPFPSVASPDQGSTPKDAD